jgi:hypothetical protein
LSFGEVARKARRLVGWLRTRGVALGDRFAWGAANEPPAAVAFSGDAQACASAPLDRTFQEPDLRFQFEDLRLKGLLPGGACNRPARAAKQPGIRAPALCPRASGPSAFGSPETANRGDADPDRIALVQQRSETTARLRNLIVPGPPRGPTGKVQRVGLWEALRQRPE